MHTGQHYDAGLSDVFFAQLGLPHPDYHLGVGSGSRDEQRPLRLGPYRRPVRGAVPPGRGWGDETARGDVTFFSH